MLYLIVGQKPNRVVVHLNTELQLPGTLYLKQLENPMSFKRKIKSITTCVKDISF